MMQDPLPPSFTPHHSVLLSSVIDNDVCVCLLSHVQVFATPWTAVRLAPLSRGFSRQEYWSGWPCPPLGDLPDPGIEAASLVPPA